MSSTITKAGAVAFAAGFLVSAAVARGATPQDAPRTPAKARLIPAVVAHARQLRAGGAS